MDTDRGLKAGIGKAVITPEGNYLMHGFGRSQVATGVHDNLHSRCLIVEDSSENMFVLLSISLVYISRDASEHIRTAVAETVGVGKESIMLSCTHTHSGPHFDKAPDSYKEFVYKQVVKSAELALNDLSPGRIGIGSGTQIEVGKNRRRLLYGGLHSDPELGVIKIEDSLGKLKGVIFNYGCHPSTLDWRNTLYSEDWPYYAIQGIKKKVGNNVWVCFLQGAQGDINTGYGALLSAIGSYMPVRDFPYIEYKGEQMSRSVLEILPDIATSRSLTVETVSEFYDLPLRKVFPVTLKEAEEGVIIARRELDRIIDKPEYQNTGSLDEYRTRFYSAEQTLELAAKFYSGELKKSESTEIQVFRLGSTVIFSLPGEIFSTIGLSVKKLSPFENTFGAGLANGYSAYMPAEDDFIDGDYEVNGSKYCPETGNVLTASITGMIKKLKLSGKTG